MEPSIPPVLGVGFDMVPMISKLLRPLLLLCMCLLAVMPSTQAATYTVSNLNSAGTGSLAEAITSAARHTWRRSW